MIQRFIKPQIQRYLDIFRVVLITGARQTGKSTLIQSLAKERGWEYHTLDSSHDMTLAFDDPKGYLSRLTKPIILDEVQRLPELFVPLKRDVDMHHDILPT